ncbi:hypothetical protein EDB84DRAFT_1441954 [Lactarius hengduanensis]|nr:hypothetical protein EDB84DRAFT_1441954 [Lactarius hengduanensis]
MVTARVLASAHLSEVSRRAEPETRPEMDLGPDIQQFKMDIINLDTWVAAVPVRHTTRERALHAPSLQPCPSICMHEPPVLFTWLRNQLLNLNFKALLPLSFEGTNGGIVLGNMSTSNGGRICLRGWSPSDLYKMLNVKFQNATITFEQYQAPIVSTGSHIHEQLRRAQQLYPRDSTTAFKPQHKASSFKRQPSDTSTRSSVSRLNAHKSSIMRLPSDLILQSRSMPCRGEGRRPPRSSSYYADTVGVVPAKHNQAPCPVPALPMPSESLPAVASFRLILAIAHQQPSQNIRAEHECTLE